MLNSKKNPSAKAAFGGIFTALTIVSLYMSVLINLVDVVFYILASVIIGICIREMGIRLATIVFMASCAVSFIIIPNLFTSLSYAMFFGLIPLIYYFFDNKLHLKIRKLLILIFDVLYAVFIYFLIGRFYGDFFNDVSYPLFLLIAFFIVYYPAYMKVTNNIYFLFKRAIK